MWSSISSPSVAGNNVAIIISISSPSHASEKIKPLRIFDRLPINFIFGPARTTTTPPRRCRIRKNQAYNRTRRPQKPPRPKYFLSKRRQSRSRVCHALTDALTDGLTDARTDKFRVSVLKRCAGSPPRRGLSKNFCSTTPHNS